MCVIICCLLIKKEAPSYVSVIVLMTGLFIAIYMLSSFSVVTGYIGVLTNSVSDICRDNGFSAVASQLELLCRVSIVLISMPVIIALLEMVNGCLK